MVYIRDWSAFETATTELYARAPKRTRYTIKFIPKTGQLVLKVTDDVKCIVYKTFSSIILNRFEALNLRLLAQMSNTKPKARLLGSESVRAGTPGLAEEDDPMTGAGAAGAGTDKAAVGSSTPAKSAGGKKKKKGKK